MAIARLILCGLILAAFSSDVTASPAQDATPSPAPVRVVGSVESVQGTAIQLKTDAGSAATIQVQDGARIVRSSPEQKSLKEATPIALPEIQVGDRMLAVGKSAAGGNILASTIVVMTKSDLAQKRRRELQDWQRRGVGGLVGSVDPAGGVIRLSTSALGQKKEVAVQVSKDTIIRRYAPDSVQFEDAKPATLDQIKPGDQLRARGNRSEDGTQLTADEIVSGSFQNVSGIVSVKDQQAGTITVNDLATKKPVVVKITPESQMRKLPEMMARVLAARLKGETPPFAGNGNGGQPPANRSGIAPNGGNGAPGAWKGANGGAHPGTGDLQSLLSRAPEVTFNDLQKGDAVMLVSTEGSHTKAATAITLLSGVEPILTASPSATFLSPWNLNAGGGEGGEGGPQ